MSISSLENKTIRPGSLGTYSYYHSDRHLPHSEIAKPASKQPNKLVIAAIAVLALITIPIILSIKNQPIKSGSGSTVNANGAAPSASASTSSNSCASNSLSQDIIVNISSRKLWACNFNKVVYSSKVVTGINTHADTSTPSGNYLIMSKQTNLTLTGSDSVGSWSDPVKYWLPFLTNQYGSYGFHDATWRTDSSFGNISPDSLNASHGCVELPLSSAQWLYNWSNVGTHVSIIN